MKFHAHRARAYTPPIVASSKSRGSGNSNSNSNAKEKVARKYCFKASCTLKDSNQAVGVFVAYDYRISVVQDVQNACETHAASLNPGVTCGDVQLTLMDECITEVTDDIYFHFLRDDDSDT